jgi:hypothetical protein
MREYSANENQNQILLRHQALAIVVQHSLVLNLGWKTEIIDQRAAALENEIVQYATTTLGRSRTDQNKTQASQVDELMEQSYQRLYDLNINALVSASPMLQVSE